MKPPKPPTKIADLSADLETPGEVVTGTMKALEIATSEPITPADAARITAAIADAAQAEADQLRALPQPPTLADLAKKATAQWSPSTAQEAKP